MGGHFRGGRRGHDPNRNLRVAVVVVKYTAAVLRQSK